jgi:hypothetical protein
MNKILSFFTKNNRLMWLEYSCLSLLILLPLLAPGYILTLDLVFTPHAIPPKIADNDFLLDGLLWVFYLFLPGDSIEKIVLFTILIVSGGSMHLLIKYLVHPDSIAAWRIAPYGAGLFYMINPFTYDRFMAGQWQFLLGYALTPLFVRSLIAITRRPSIRSGIVAGLWAFVITTASVHHTGILLLLGGIGATALIITKKLAITRRFVTPAMAGVGIWLLLSLPWIVPALFSQSSIGSAVTSFDASHFAAFATDGNGIVGKIANVVRLQGFWVESQQLFLLPQSITPLWGLIFIFFWIVAGLGAAVAWKNRRGDAWFALGCVVLGILAAATPIIQWMSLILPPLAGFREPHKFASLVALGFAILFAFGLAGLCGRYRRHGPIIAGIALLLPVALTPTMLGGFAGQLTPRHYPQSWARANDWLAHNTANHAVLFLPWHQYADYSFSQRIIATPAEKYFTANIIASDDPEFGNVSPTSPNQQKQVIASALATPPNARAASLSRIGIRYVMLAHEQDYKSYSWLSPYTPVAYQNDDITIYALKETN